LLDPPFEQLRHVRVHIALDQVVGMELAQQLDDVLLGRGVLGQFVGQPLPHRRHVPLAVHEADDPVGGGVEAVILARDPVLHHVPDLAPVGVAVDADVAAQARPQMGHAIPVGGQQGGGHDFSGRLGPGGGP
jgi:hypothetical protein